MKFNIEQINVVRGYLTERFQTFNVDFISSSDNKVTFKVNEQLFSIVCDNDFNVTILYVLYGRTMRVQGGYSLSLLENKLFEVA